jgi:predicted O-methyltransferase YrrM
VPAPPDLTAGANRALQQEVKELRARVAALEASRWWRLHPRFALARALARLGRRREPDAAPPRPETGEPGRDDGGADRFRTEVASRGRFSEDWFTVHIPSWEPVVRELEGRSARVLELGSFEGLSACYLLWRLPDARLTCVDTFTGLAVWTAYGISAEELETTFDSNVALVDESRVRKLAGATRRILPDLLDAGEQFDLAYVDASHKAVDVLVDAGLTWQLLAPRGVMICDDYGPVPPGYDPMLRPRPALQAFRATVASEAEVVGEGRQLIIRKLA